MRRGLMVCTLALTCSWVLIVWLAWSYNTLEHERDDARLMLQNLCAHSATARAMSLGLLAQLLSVTGTETVTVETSLGPWTFTSDGSATQVVSPFVKEFDSTLTQPICGNPPWVR